MAAALFAKRAGASVLLLEHNEKLGKKLYITGKGRCNVTNNCEQEEFLSSVPRNPRFLYAALNHLSPRGLIDLLNSLGCPTVTERGKRVFPASQKASDITKAFASKLDAKEVRLNARVADIVVENQQVMGVKLSNDEFIPSGAVILATGGLSYPITGSTGIGHELAKRLGHSIMPCTPSLTGFNTRDEWPQTLQGLTLKNVALHASWPKRGKFSEQGELLFTHFGVSGPLVLSLSGMLAGSDPTAAELTLDLKPALSPGVLEERLLNDMNTSSRKTLSNLLRAYLPASMADIFPEIIGLDGAVTMNQFTQKDRETLIQGFKHLPVHLHSARSFKEAVVTCGGVDVKEVNPSTMASKKVAGLFFAGELLDVDALTGGFNLQIAFSTGALAGSSAARFIHH
ncbi:MAG: NAD(P)/FAD-dependent oxidoreductase [Clostridiales bacterium]|nr:NAD(P)/FAD-dependent oxidoreductase [Clostridiales bacterium]